VPSARGLKSGLRTPRASLIRSPIVRCSHGAMPTPGMTRVRLRAGIRQFLDLGTGLPTAQNTHQVAQAIAPDARIVYVDNDSIVLTYARALLTSAGCLIRFRQAAT
jgi:hypothetical protein